MPAPTVDQTRSAAAVINALTPTDFQRRKTQEVGDALMAFFVILAKKLFPNDPENATVRRVQLMLASYFLRGELDRTSVPAPDEFRAQQAAAAVAALSGPALEQRMSQEVGDPVLAFFRAFADTQMVEKDEKASAGKVHLMVLAYLLRGDLS